jgi:hypothetical protein
VGVDASILLLSNLVFFIDYSLLRFEMELLVRETCRMLCETPSSPIVKSILNWEDCYPWVGSYNVLADCLCDIVRLK